MKKITKALLAVSLAAAANVAMADNSYYPSNDSGLAGFPAIPGGTARSYADEHPNDRVLQGDAVIPSNGHALAGFDPIPGGTARSYAEMHRNDPVQYAAPAFPSSDSELAGFAPIQGGSARSYTDTHSKHTSSAD